MDIKKILDEKKNQIDKVIEKYIPRVYDKKSLEFTCGVSHFTHDTKTATESIAKPIWELLERGGKRWRPTLLLLVCEALGGQPEKFLDLVVIPEIIHNGTLMIDDIEDSSEMRRGKPAVHKIFGEDITINAGNAMYYLPLLVLLRSELPEKLKLKAYEIYIQEMINLSFGQGYDIYWHKTKIIPSIDQYLQMCAFKTGTLARMSAKIGALVADASDEVIEKVGRFAETLGIGFQIQDDILNLKPKEAWGKETGEDITEGKKTLLVIHALQNASEENKKRLIEILDMHTKDEKLIKEAINIIEGCGSFEYAKEFAKKMIKEAWSEVKDIFIDGCAKKTLESFVSYVVEREI